MKTKLNKLIEFSINISNNKKNLLFLLKCKSLSHEKVSTYRTFIYDFFHKMQ